MKVAAALQQIVLISKEIDLPDDVVKAYQQNPVFFQIPITPQDRPVVKQIIDVFDEDCNVLFSIGRDSNDNESA